MSDICIILLLLFAFCDKQFRSFDTIDRQTWLLGGFFSLAILSLAHAQEVVIGMVQIVRLAEFILLFFYLRYRAYRIFDAELSALLFIVGALMQAILGIGQFILQHDVGLRWIGETLLRVNLHGVAVFYDGVGHKILRAYGTLPHPNILAAYIMMALWLFLWLWIRHTHSSRWYVLLWQGVLGTLLVGFYLTFSRTIIAVWMISWLVLAGIDWRSRGVVSGDTSNEIRRKIKTIGITVLMVSLGFVVLLKPLIVARMTISTADEAVQLRIRYNREALSSGMGTLMHVNWIGVGIGNFTSWLVRYDRALPTFLVQPVHNVYLLAYSEMGAVGLLVWMLWMISIARVLWKTYAEQPLVRAGLCILFVSVLGIGALDHFYWTLQQGRILWWATLALVAREA